MTSFSETFESLAKTADPLIMPRMCAQAVDRTRQGKQERQKQREEEQRNQQN